MWDNLISHISHLKNMKLEILTPDKKVYEGEIRSVTVPGTMGSIEVLKDHAPIISTLEDGKVIIRKDNSSDETIYIKGGVIEVLNNSIMVLAEGIQDSWSLNIIESPSDH